MVLAQFQTFLLVAGLCHYFVCISIIVLLCPFCPSLSIFVHLCLCLFFIALILCQVGWCLVAGLRHYLVRISMIVLFLSIFVHLCPSLSIFVHLCPSLSIFVILIHCVDFVSSGLVRWPGARKGWCRWGGRPLRGGRWLVRWWPGGSLGLCPRVRHLRVCLWHLMCVGCASQPASASPGGRVCHVRGCPPLRHRWWRRLGGRRVHVGRHFYLIPFRHERGKSKKVTF